MDAVWWQIVSFLGFFTLAIISPGPNFILVVNIALGGSRRDGLLTALGVATGSGLYALAGLLGVIALLETLPSLAFALRILGSGYLVYLGIGMLIGSWQLARRLPAKIPSIPAAPPGKVFLRGLVTNLSNPKAWAFYLSLFTLVLVPGTPTWAKGLLNIGMFLISFAWYATVALLISHRRVQPLFNRVQPLVQGILGTLLIGLGGKLLVR